jgi:hypothetical protein
VAHLGGLKRLLGPASLSCGSQVTRAVETLGSSCLWNEPRNPWESWLRTVFWDKAFSSYLDSFPSLGASLALHFHSFLWIT